MFSKALLQFFFLRISCARKALIQITIKKWENAWGNYKLGMHSAVHFYQSLLVLELLEEPSWKSFTSGSSAGSRNENQSQIRYTNHPNAMTQPGKVSWLMVRTDTFKFV